MTPILCTRKRLSIFSFLTVLGIVLSGWPFFSWAQEGGAQDKAAEFFFYRCAGCHTIGGGKLAGPDLVTAAQWSSVDLKPAIKKMEKNVGPLSDADIDQVIEFLKDLGVSTRIARQRQKIEARLRAELPPPSFETGQKLFRGQKALRNGGPACISCHRFIHEGGNLGPDLTFIKDRASGVVLQSAIGNSSYKIMRPIYEKRKITGEEALHLAEYLSHPEKIEAGFAATVNKAVGSAVAGFGAFFALVWGLNQRRKRGARENLFRKT